MFGQSDRAHLEVGSFLGGPERRRCSGCACSGLPRAAGAPPTGQLPLHGMHPEKARTIRAAGTALVFRDRIVRSAKRPSDGSSRVPITMPRSRNRLNSSQFGGMSTLDLRNTLGDRVPPQQKLVPTRAARSEPCAGRRSSKFDGAAAVVHLPVRGGRHCRRPGDDDGCEHPVGDQHQRPRLDQRPPWCASPVPPAALAVVRGDRRGERRNGPAATNPTSD